MRTPPTHVAAGNGESTHLVGSHELRSDGGCNTNARDRVCGFEVLRAKNGNVLHQHRPPAKQPHDRENFFFKQVTGTDNGTLMYMEKEEE